MVLINCLNVSDDEPFQHIFTVQVSPDETIGQLRGAILSAKPRWRKRINPDDLTLYTPKQMISTYSKDIFHAIFTRLKLSALNELNPTFTVDESGLSQPARHQLHVLVMVHAKSISPSNSSNSGLSDILVGELPAKRLHVEGSVMSDGLIEHIHSKIPPMMLDYYRRFWGIPLDPALTILPDRDNTTDSESEEEESNDDILPGEPFLKDVGLPMLVRAEYIRVLDAVKAAHQKSHNTSLAVVTGQPGIGKTSWIHYAVRYCLGERQPVVWYQVEKCYFFSESGVDIIDPMLHQSGGKHTWCLVDSLDAPQTLPHSICSQSRQLFPIYVTSPKLSCWFKLYQSGRLPELIIMNPWSLDELEKAAQLYPDRKLEDIRERYENAGPTAQLCLAFDSEAIQGFYNSRDRLIKSITTPKSLEKFMNESNALLTDQFPHQWFMLNNIIETLLPHSERQEYVQVEIAKGLRGHITPPIVVVSIYRVVKASLYLDGNDVGDVLRDDMENIPNIPNREYKLRPSSLYINRDRGLVHKESMLGTGRGHFHRVYPQEKTVWYKRRVSLAAVSSPSKTQLMTFRIMVVINATESRFERDFDTLLYLRQHLQSSTHPRLNIQRDCLLAPLQTRRWKGRLALVYSLLLLACGMISIASGIGFGETAWLGHAASCKTDGLAKSMRRSSMETMGNVAFVAANLLANGLPIGTIVLD
ncbi:hypothetical protein BU17DRAFT_95255 [Hysterangium stoloniferum]|nr:hypothetical protein BU17DRAFT_95255 [Hysterangium stoloniferum]